MNTATQANIPANLISAMKQGGMESINDRTRRFCYTGGTPMMSLAAKNSGLDCNPITGGRLHHLVAKRQFYGGAYDAYKKQYPRLFNWELPGDFARVLEQRFQQTADMGFRNLPMLTALPHSLDATTNQYYDDAPAYFNVVHPFVGECPFGLNKDVQLTDPQAGQSTPVFQHCPTCQLKDLESQACLDRISNAVQSNPAVYNEKTLLELRDTLIEANRATISYIERSLAAVKAEIDSRRAGSPQGRTHFNTIDNIEFKMMHKEPARDEQSTLITQLVQGLSANQVPPVAQTTNPVLTDEQIAQLAAFTEWQAEQKAKKEADAERMAKVRAGRKTTTED